MECPECGQQAKSAAGLASHRRSRHPQPSEASGPNLAAIEATLTELHRMGRLERVDAARVQAIKSMARALDDNPFNSQMWREYREALERLTADDSNDGAADALLAKLSAHGSHTEEG